MIINFFLNEGIIKVESEEERETLLNVLRPQGEWIIDDEDDIYRRCSECGYEQSIYSLKRNFCPNCGADMRGGKGK